MSTVRFGLEVLLAKVFEALASTRPAVQYDEFRSENQHTERVGNSNFVRDLRFVPRGDAVASPSSTTVPQRNLESPNIQQESGKQKQVR